MTNARKLTEGALFLAIFAVLLLITLYIPVLGIVINLFLALPFIMYSVKNDRKSAVVFLVAALLISLIIGSVLAIPLALSYGVTGIVIGDFIREKKSRVAMFIGGSIAFLLSLVVEYAISVALFEIDFIKEMLQMFNDSIDRSMQILTSLGQTPDPLLLEQFETSIQMIEVLIPSMFVLASFMVVFLIQLVSLPILKRFGMEIPSWLPFRELTLPRSLLWYYLIVLLVSILFNPTEGSYWYSAILNVTFILQFFMLLQGLSLVFYYSFKKSFPKFIPILVTVLLFFMPIVLYIVRILGIIDLGLDLRKRIAGKD